MDNWRLVGHKAISIMGLDIFIRDIIAYEIFPRVELS